MGYECEFFLKGFVNTSTGISNHFFWSGHVQNQIWRHFGAFKSIRIRQRHILQAHGEYSSQNYKVTKQGWYNLVFVLCPKSFYADPSAKPVLLNIIL